jgi:OOP family OmpA-OmpF porin
MKERTMRIAQAGLACLALTAALAGCRAGEEPEPAPSETAQPTSAPSPSDTPVSIIRPDIVAEVSPEPEPGPFEATVPFATGGHTLDEAAEAVLAGVLDSAQLAEGWPVVLRGHTDSTGEDSANLKASRRRAEAVADWLVEHGVDRKRITMIPLGEQRPVAPNAHLDGTPDEEGRAKNRRVTVTIAPPPPENGDTAAPAEPETSPSG